MEEPTVSVESATASTVYFIPLVLEYDGVQNDGEGARDTTEGNQRKVIKTVIGHQTVM
jgi:hypothetical protein